MDRFHLNRCHSDNHSLIYGNDFGMFDVPWCADQIDGGPELKFIFCSQHYQAIARMHCMNYISAVHHASKDLIA